VRRKRLVLAEGLERITRRLDVVPFVTQQLRERAAGVRLVIDHENPTRLAHERTFSERRATKDQPVTSISAQSLRGRR
jgi:hypothetical protein